MSEVRNLSAAWMVVDIEGTTSSTASVHDGLYSYARPRLGPWIDAHAAEESVREAVAQVRAEAGLPAEAGTPEVVAILHDWMNEDVKATPLKTLQGQIWAAGFASGELVSHFFPDVPPALRAWRAAGVRLAVFSSGSVAAQQAWFSHGETGDMSGLIEHHFDTVNAGPKREPASYARITDRLGAPTRDVVFVSDVPAELDAAAAAGLATVGAARPGEPYATADFGRHATIASFADLRLVAVPEVTA